MDKANVESIADRYLDSIYRIAVNYCKNTDDAEDAVQNAFLKMINTDTVFTEDEHTAGLVLVTPLPEDVRNK